MIGITADQVEELAGQASLEITGDEREELAGRLNHLLETIAPVLELGGSPVEPTLGAAQAPGKSVSRKESPAAVWREDEVRPSLPLKKVFQNVSTRDGDYFKVPRITGLEG